MKSLRIIFLTLLAISLMITVPATLFLHSVTKTVLKPYNFDYYLNQTSINQEIEVTVKDAIKNSNHDNELVQEAIQGQIATTVEKEINEEWISTKLDFVQKEIWDYLLGKEKTVQPIPIDDIKQEIIHNVTGTVPDKVLNQLKKQIPDRINWLQIVDLKEKDLAKIKDYYNEIVSAENTLFITVAITLILAGLLAFDIKRILKWIGLSLVFSSVSSFLLSIFVKITSFDTKTSSEIFNTLFNVIKTDVMNKMGTEAMTLFIIGVVISLIAFKPKNK